MGSEREMPETIYAYMMPIAGVSEWLGIVTPLPREHDERPPTAYVRASLLTAKDAELEAMRTQLAEGLDERWRKLVFALARERAANAALRARVERLTVVRLAAEVAVPALHARIGVYPSGESARNTGRLVDAFRAALAACDADGAP